MTRVSLEPSYVLHGRPYRETSLLLEAFSRDHGRTGLVARGARGARSRWKNMLQPFRPLLLSWTQRGELGTLTGAEQVASPPALSGERLFCGLYANELLIRFLQRADPHARLFEGYRTLLAGLADAGNPQPLLRVFEKDLLQSLGFGLLLDHEHDTGAEISPEAWYEYLPESGPVRRDASPDRLGNLLSGASLLALKSGSIGEEHQKELKALMRGLIRYHLGDRPLASHSLFKE